MYNKEIDNSIIEYINNYKNTHKIFRPTIVLSKEQILYIKNRYAPHSEAQAEAYTDTSDLKENIYRLLNNIESIPLCPVCKKEKRKWNGSSYNKYCSKKCSALENSAFKDAEKIRNAIYNKYGVYNVLSLKETHEKAKRTKLLRYGDENYRNKEKFVATCLKKYGCKYPAQNKEIRQKQKETSFNRYGGYFNKEQVSKTIQERYGMKWFVYSDKVKEKSHTKEALEKQINTKKKNHTFNVSKQEERCYELLCNKYGKEDVIRQYKSDVYPFACDFYIKNINTYIECNFHWTHGEHKFDCNNQDDIDKLNKWKEKAKTSNFYINAISTWTERDVNKYNIVKKNNLNYLVFYNEKDFKDYFSN